MLSILKKPYVKEQGSYPNKFEILLVKRQQLLADALQKESKKLNRKTLYFLLAVFCLCFGTAFIRIAVAAIQDDHPVIFAGPQRVTQTGSLPIGKDYKNIQRQWKYIHNLKEYLDSIKKRERMDTK